jgi:L-ascorbate metabolism protein UlaG (beta-lactamase superfamily)
MAPDVDSLGFVGHSTTLIRLGDATAITDPFLRGNLGPLRRQGGGVDPTELGSPEVILLSHLHRDHLDLRSLRRLPHSAAAVVPRGALDLVARGGPREIVELSPGESATVAGLEIEATIATHGGHRDRTWGSAIEPLGFVVSAGNRRVYFAGDTDLFDEMSALAPLDAALLPVWGWGPTVGSGHLDPERAAEALRLLRPRIAIPIHWGTLYPAGLARLRPDRLIEPPLEFERAAQGVAPEVAVHVLQPGQSLALDEAAPRQRA